MACPLRVGVLRRRSVHHPLRVRWENTVRKETVAFGDVEQTSLTVGDRSTSVNLISITHSSTVGSVTLKSAGNSVVASPESVTIKAILGDTSVQSTVGNVAITGSLGVGIRSVGKVSVEAPSIVLNAGSTATGSLDLFFVLLISTLWWVRRIRRLGSSLEVRY